MDAYILVTTEQGTEEEVYKQIFNFPEVLGAHMIFGEWDLMVKVRVEHTDALSTFIIEKLRQLNGVNITSTLIVAK